MLTGDACAARADFGANNERQSIHDQIEVSSTIAGSILPLEPHRFSRIFHRLDKLHAAHQQKQKIFANPTAPTENSSRKKGFVIPTKAFVKI